MSAWVAQSAAVVTYGQLHISVSSEDSATLVWLGEFLGPSFSVRSTHGPDAAFRVVFTIDVTQHQRLREQLAACEDEVECFTMDGSFSRHRGSRGTDGGVCLHVDESAFCVIDSTGRDIHLIAAQASHRERALLMRVVRELATTQALSEGRLPIHAAAFEHEGEVVLVCGPKRSGKTSLLTHALCGGSRFVANDRVFVSTGRVALVQGMPTIVALRDGALGLFPRVREAYDAARFDYARTIAECEQGAVRPAPRRPPGMDRPGISPAQFCRLVGADMTVGGPLRLILLASVDERARGVSCARLDPRAAQDAFARSLLRPSQLIRSSPTFGTAEKRTTIDAVRERQLCSELLERVPIYACTLGSGAYSLPVAAVLPE